jgi:hypothetical protein
MPSTGWPYTWPDVEARTGAFSGSFDGDVGFGAEAALAGCMRWYLLYPTVLAPTRTKRTSSV